MNKTVGGRLRAWRERQKPALSQERAAELVGAPQRTWADWELGGKTPEIDYAEAIERLTGGKIRMRDWARGRRAKRIADRDRERRKREESGPSLDEQAKSA